MGNKDSVSAVIANCYMKHFKQDVLESYMYISPYLFSAQFTYLDAGMQ